MPLKQPIKAKLEKDKKPVEVKDRVADFRSKRTITVLRRSGNLTSELRKSLKLGQKLPESLSEVEKLMAEVAPPLNIRSMLKGIIYTNKLRTNWQSAYKILLHEEIKDGSKPLIKLDLCERTKFISNELPLVTEVLKKLFSPKVK